MHMYDEHAVLLSVKVNLLTQLVWNVQLNKLTNPMK